jgi:hypothetical protein
MIAGSGEDFHVKNNLDISSLLLAFSIRDIENWLAVTVKKIMKSKGSKKFHHYFRFLPK